MVLNKKDVESKKSIERSKEIFSNDMVKNLVATIRAINDITKLKELKDTIHCNNKDMLSEIEESKARTIDVMKVLNDCIEEQYQILKSVN